MCVVILAAGLGKRFSADGQLPKCLVKLGDFTLIERMIAQLLSRGLSRFVVVLGFSAQRIKDFLRERFPQLAFHFCYNSEFLSTNNAFSLYMAKDVVREGFFLLDGDLVFDSQVLDLMLHAAYQNALALRPSHCLGEEEMKIQVNSQANRILAVNKSMNPGCAQGESLGIARFSQETALLLFAQLEKNMSSPQKKKYDFYEQSFEDLIHAGVEFYAVNLGSLPCVEIDFPEDLDYARDNILPLLDQV